MSSELDPAHDPLDELAHAVLELIADRATAADEARRPDPEVIRALGDRGLLRLVVPRCFGGLEVHPSVFMDFTERISWVNGSAGWTAMTCNEEAGIASVFFID